MNVITMKYKCNQRDMNEPRMLQEYWRGQQITSQQKKKVKWPCFFKYQNVFSICPKETFRVVQKNVTPSLVFTKLSYVKENFITEE